MLVIAYRHVIEFDANFLTLLDQGIKYGLASHGGTAVSLFVADPGAVKCTCYDCMTVGAGEACDEASTGDSGLASAAHSIAGFASSHKDSCSYRSHCFHRFCSSARHDRLEQRRLQPTLQPVAQPRIGRLGEPLRFDPGELAHQRQQGRVGQARMLGEQVGMLRQ